MSISPRTSWPDKIFKSTVLMAALSIGVLVLTVLLALIISSTPTLKQFGIQFLWGTNWDPVMEEFGALPFIWGTFVSSFLALLIAIPISLGIAVFLSELAPEWLRNPVSYAVELLAAIPSIIYGAWGLFVLAPLLQVYLEPWLQSTLGFLPFFQGTPLGVGMLLAGIILAIMIIPTITSISKEVILTVPRTQKEAALALGMTHWETISKVILPYAKSGILGAIILGWGRAVGETMASTMVIGNAPNISLSLFDPAYTLGDVITNEFTEAVGDLHISALIEIGWILLVITFIIIAAARLLVWATSYKGGKAE